MTGPELIIQTQLREDIFAGEIWYKSVNTVDSWSSLPLCVPRIFFIFYFSDIEVGPA